MTFQTVEKDDTNRYKNSPEGLDSEIRSIWLGWRDSNPRMSAPKADALPLGDTPICNACRLWTPIKLCYCTTV